MRHTQKLVVENALGLHLRPAAELVRAVQAFQADIVFSGNGKSASAKSTLSLLMMGAAGGMELTVTADGADAADALLAIKHTGHLSETKPPLRDHPESTPWRC
jgi:phosphotransferase system HPr (HPr) family protein